MVVCLSICLFGCCCCIYGNQTRTTSIVDNQSTVCVLYILSNDIISIPRTIPHKNYIVRKNKNIVSVQIVCVFAWKKNRWFKTKMKTMIKKRSSSSRNILFLWRKKHTHIPECEYKNRKMVCVCSKFWTKKKKMFQN